MTGIKHDQDKPQFRLIPPKAELAFAKVLTMGAKKYAPDNWKQIEPHRYVDALMRHLNAFRQGEVNDPESGEHHMAHIMCCAAFILEQAHYMTTPTKRISRFEVGDTFYWLDSDNEIRQSTWYGTSTDLALEAHGNAFLVRSHAEDKRTRGHRDARFLPSRA